jgi:hypothetical protein
MHVAVGHRLWWRAQRRSEVDFWAHWLAGAPGTEQWASDREASARCGGLHQWNVDALDKSLVVWNNAVRVDVGIAFAGRPHTTAWVSPDEVVARLVVTGTDGGPGAE